MTEAVWISDTHQHGWSAFSATLPDGTNSRNQIILDETLRAAQVAFDRGIKTLIHAGDLFHVRGAIAPSVLNPTLATYRWIVEEMGMRVIMIPGNHDLEGKESSRLTNAVEAMTSVGVQVVHKPGVIQELDLAVMPWFSSVEQFQWALEDLRAHIMNDLDDDPGNYDLVIHAPVDGVIEGLPDHGLTAEWLADQGFGRVFAGHYHNHKDFGNEVYSIGALTHQTWGDVGARAGFLLTPAGEGVIYNASHAPQFIDLEPGFDPDDVPLVVDGNYVRVRVEVEHESEITDLRDWLTKECGAAGVVIMPLKKGAVVSRSGATVKSGASMQQSIAEFIKLKGFKKAKAVQAACEDILVRAEVEA